MIVAFDGPAGSGKSTVAAAVAQRLGLQHVDTGAMYRALALKVVREGVEPADEAGVADVLKGTRIELEGPGVLLDGVEVGSQIREAAVTEVSSQIATHARVRAWMVERQRAAARSGQAGASVEGRDIGTVVLPDADLKVYLTASEHVRARRRGEQAGMTLEQARAEVAGRDARDTSRRHSPLRRADGAVEIDTTDMTVDEVVDRVVELLEAAVR